MSAYELRDVISLDGWLDEEQSWLYGFSQPLHAFYAMVFNELADPAYLDWRWGPLHVMDEAMPPEEAYVTADLMELERVIASESARRSTGDEVPVAEIPPEVLVALTEEQRRHRVWPGASAGEEPRRLIAGAHITPEVFHALREEQRRYFKLAAL